MSTFSAKDVQALRQATGAGMMDCKRALEECEGDFEAAKQLLREKGLAQSIKRSDREASQGAVAIARADAGVAMVELRCETDFVAKAPDFTKLADELAAAVAAEGEDAAASRQGDVDELGVVLKENISVGRVVRFASEAGTVIGDYLHIQNGRGVNSVLVQLRGGDDELAHEIAVHIAFARPEFLHREDVPAEQVAAERATVEQISRNEGKPEQALSKIVEGRMNGWFKERVLVEQPFVRDDKRSVAEVAGSAQILRFAQVVIGD